jgi:hypothetical protein
MVLAFSELGFIDLDYHVFAADPTFVFLYFVGRQLSKQLHEMGDGGR